MNTLHAHELDNLPEISEESAQRYQITDIHSLNWALRKMAAISAKKADVNELADAEIERIEAFRKRELDSLQQSEDFFRSLIGTYAMRRRHEDPSFKGEKTIYGRIGLRKQQPKYSYDDEKLLSFLESNDYADLIRVKKEPVKTEIKKRFILTDNGQVVDENGQAVEGISVEYLPDTLDVKVEE